MLLSGAGLPLGGESSLNSFGQSILHLRQSALEIVQVVFVKLRFSCRRGAEQASSGASASSRTRLLERVPSQIHGLRIRRPLLRSLIVIIKSPIATHHVIRHPTLVRKYLVVVVPEMVHICLIVIHLKLGNMLPLVDSLGVYWFATRIC